MWKPVFLFLILPFNKMERQIYEHVFQEMIKKPEKFHILFKVK